MDGIIIFISGVMTGAGAVYFVAKNNQKKINKALNLDPKAKLQEAIDNLKERLKR